MPKKRGRPKEPKNVQKINPVNVHLENTTSTDTFTGFSTLSETAFTSVISYKCDTPRCNSKAEVFINLKYCPLCAKDKGF